MCSTCAGEVSGINFLAAIPLFNQLVARFVDRKGASGAEVSINGSGVAQIGAASLLGAGGSVSAHRRTSGAVLFYPLLGGFSGPLIIEPRFTAFASCSRR